MGAPASTPAPGATNQAGARIGQQDADLDREDLVAKLREAGVDEVEIDATLRAHERGGGAARPSAQPHAGRVDVIPDAPSDDGLEHHRHAHEQRDEQRRTLEDEASQTRSTLNQVAHALESMASVQRAQLNQARFASTSGSLEAATAAATEAVTRKHVVSSVQRVVERSGPPSSGYRESAGRPDGSSGTLRVTTPPPAPTRVERPVAPIDQRSPAQS
jgi:hypothetical protein